MFLVKKIRGEKDRSGFKEEKERKKREGGSEGRKGNRRIKRKRTLGWRVVSYGQCCCTDWNILPD